MVLRSSQLRKQLNDVRIAALMQQKQTVMGLDKTLAGKSMNVGGSLI